MVQDVEFTVLARTRRTPVIVEVALRPVSEPLPYVAGQYALLGDRDYTIPVRSYSIANAPCASNRISLLVTRVPDGKTSKWVHDSLAVGDTVLVSGPYGTFVADPAGDRPVLCLAGGSGLAPVRALAEEAVSRRSPEDFTLLFSGRTRLDVMDAETFVGWQERHPGFRFRRTLTRGPGVPPLGRMPKLLPTLFTDLSGHDIFIAGGPGFVSACAHACRLLGAAPGHLHTEEFFADPRPWNSTVVAEAVS